MGSKSFSITLIQQQTPKAIPIIGIEWFLPDGNPQAHWDAACPFLFCESIANANPPLEKDHLSNTGLSPELPNRKPLVSKWRHRNQSTILGRWHSFRRVARFSR